jgi:hypothetical protein
MRTFTALIAIFAASISSVIAQGTTTINRPAGTDFNVTTGIGSNATVTTHAPLPEPSVTRPPVEELPLLPDENSSDKSTKSSEDEVVQPFSGSAAPPDVDGPNAIARDRIESPHDGSWQNR